MSAIAEAWERTKRAVVEVYRPHAAPNAGAGLHSLRFKRDNASGEETVGIAVFLRTGDGTSTEYEFSCVVPTNEELYIRMLDSLAEGFRTSVDRLMGLPS
ncbi:MAG: hypothetical protein EPN98_21410 [Phenylobacterium sp.]|uniref:hypothetical protein n=1 Tax=Phenylobacterium sp. TaxID=1871053 RepID=UPI00121DD71D|nr:hypothetical protein [Phenylobacterium sp.]TAL29003.1 MAG: hypothetical protein EPN98_21410 [Phenylobacterium sp.]